MPASSRTTRLGLILLSVLVVAIAIFFLVEFISSSGDLTEEEKVAGREDCVEVLAEPSYAITDVSGCQTLWSGMREQCIAWVSEDDSVCLQLTAREQAWCLAKAYRSPAECDVLPEGEADFCKAFVTRDGSKCDAIQSETWRGKCLLTIKGDRSMVDANIAGFCGGRMVS